MIVKYFALPLVALLASTSLFASDEINMLIQNALDRAKQDAINQKQQAAEAQKRWYNSLATFDIEIAAGILEKEYGLKIN